MRDQDTFEASFPDLLRAANRAALSVVRDSTVSEDVAAETLHRVFVHWHRLDPATRDAWTRRVAHNLAIDEVRRRQPRVAMREVVDGEPELIAERVDLVAALSQLPPRQREAIAFRYFADLSEAEVATSLRISLNTARTHLRRALAALRERLGPDADRILSTARRYDMPIAMKEHWTISADAHPRGRLVDRRTIRYERHFTVAVSKAWEALVGQLDDTAALGAWFIPITTHLEPHVGGRFWFGSEDDEVLTGVVIALDPETTMVLSFRNGSGSAFQLAPTHDGCSLVYTHWMQAEFTLPQDRPDDGVDLSRTDNFAWNHQPLGPGSYQPALAACWQGSLYGLDAHLGGTHPDVDPFDATKLYEQYRDDFLAAQPVW